MNRRGLALTELIIVMVVGGILIIAVAIQFVMLTSLKMTVEDRVYAMREARIIMNHMTRVLRVADPSTITFDNGTAKTIHAWVSAGHTSLITADNYYYYKTDAAQDPLNPQSFWFGKAGSPYTWRAIGESVTSFDTDNTGNRLWNYSDPAKRLLTLRFTVTKNNVSVPVETKIKVVGDD